jgi:hypothetical protein
MRSSYIAALHSVYENYEKSFCSCNFFQYLAEYASYQFNRERDTIFALGQGIYYWTDRVHPNFPAFYKGCFVQHELFHYCYVRLAVLSAVGWWYFIYIMYHRCNKLEYF